jgi:hypothetical protein
LREVSTPTSPGGPVAPRARRSMTRYPGACLLHAGPSVALTNTWRGRLSASTGSVTACHLTRRRPRASRVRRFVGIGNKKVERVDGRLPSGIETAAYFVVAEAVTSVAKYARVGEATVRIRRENGSAVVEVGDDGVGGADPVGGSGLRGPLGPGRGARRRARAPQPAGWGTTLRARLPCT